MSLNGKKIIQLCSKTVCMQIRHHPFMSSTRCWHFQRTVICWETLYYLFIGVRWFFWNAEFQTLKSLTVLIKLEELHHIQPFLRLNGEHPHKYLTCFKSIHFFFTLLFNSLNTLKRLHAGNPLVFMQEEASILDTKWNLKNEDHAHWNQVLDKQKFQLLTWKYLGTRHSSSKIWQNTQLWGVRMCSTAGYHLLP